LNDCVDSTYVSSVGKYVDEFEEKIASYVGAKYAIATSNGTSALHVALKLLGVNENSEVLTQALSFVATVNAISYCNAKPIFIDVSKKTMGLSPKKLLKFLKKHTFMNENTECINKSTKKVIKACVPMHTFGHPCEIDKIVSICEKFNIDVVEDAAESLGSFYKNKHTGTFGKIGVFSFNGNKIITTGGGGMIVTDDEEIAKRAKHLTTTSKVPHKWEYEHDEIGFNYRMPNINAALGVAQLENLKRYLYKKRELSFKYSQFFKDEDLIFIQEPKDAKSNYWLQAVILKDKKQRDEFLEVTNKNGVMTRPIWKLLNVLEMYNNCQCDSLKNSKWFEKRVVNIPSSVIC
ncbi:MAG: LegC family aminotransferase, partial [Campylobacteraceae bacterium]|nr:LegC family aminotransferase [Campylobacteraceae bacterium]